MRKRFPISKYVLHRRIEECFYFLEAKFLNTEYSGSPNECIRVASLSKAIIGPMIRRNGAKIGCKLLLFTNRRSHINFLLVPELVILNDLGRNEVYLRHITTGKFGAN